MTRRRIDVHTNQIRPVWPGSFKSHAGGPSSWGARTWSPGSLDHQHRILIDQGAARVVRRFAAEAFA